MAFSPLRSDLIFYPPVYPYFVGALFRGFGTMRAVLWAQAVLGALLVPVVGRVGALAFGRRAGLLAAAITAFYPELLWYPAHYWSETLFLLLLWGAIERTLAADARASRGAAAVAGLLVGPRDAHARALALPRADRGAVDAEAASRSRPGRPARLDSRPDPRGGPCTLVLAWRPCSRSPRGRSATRSSSARSSRSRRWAGSTSGRETRRSRTCRSTRCWPRSEGRSSRTATAARWPGRRSPRASRRGSSRSSPSRCPSSGRPAARCSTTWWAERPAARFRRPPSWRSSCLVVLPYLAALGLFLVGLVRLRFSGAAWLLLLLLAAYNAAHVVAYATTRFRLPVLPIVFMVAAALRRRPARGHAPAAAGLAASPARRAGPRRSRDARSRLRGAVTPVRRVEGLDGQLPAGAVRLAQVPDRPRARSSPSCSPRPSAGACPCAGPRCRAA